MAIRVAKYWNELPPTVYDGDEAISTRVLEKNHRDCHAVATALLEYIDSIPKDIDIPSASGVDRDWVEEVLKRTV